MFEHYMREKYSAEELVEMALGPRPVAQDAFEHYMHEHYSDEELVEMALGPRPKAQEEADRV